MTRDPVVETVGRVRAIGDRASALPPVGPAPQLLGSVVWTTATWVVDCAQQSLWRHPRGEFTTRQ
jgi:hypothetical protein